MDLEIEKILVLSNAHITEEDGGWLDSYGPYIFTFGWVLNTNGYARNISENIRRCVELAKENDCSMIKFDRDGPVVPELPTFNWDSDIRKK